MNILVDDQPYTLTGAADQTVGELANEVCQNSTRPSCMVVSLTLDGQRIEQAQLGDVLKSPINSFGTLEIQTQSTSALVKATLSQTLTLFDEAAGARTRAADLLNEGEPEPAMHHLQKVFDFWRQIQQTMLVCAEAIGAGLEDLRANDKTLSNIFDDLKRILNDLKEAMLNRDYVLVSDILRYECDGPFDDWKLILQSLEERAEAVHAAQTGE